MNEFQSNQLSFLPFLFLILLFFGCAMPILNKLMREMGFLWFWRDPSVLAPLLFFLLHGADFVQRMVIAKHCSSIIMCIKWKLQNTVRLLLRAMEIVKHGTRNITWNFHCQTSRA